MKSINKKRICFFNSTQVWGGGEKWHFDVAKLLNTDVFEKVIFTNIKSELFDKCKNANLNVCDVKVTNISFLNPFKLVQLVNKFKKLDIDVIILNLPSDLKFAGIAAKIAKIPRIIYRRGSAIPVRNTMLNRFLFKSIITDIIANSYATKKTILSHSAFADIESKIQVIYNGIEIKKVQKCTTLYNKKPNEIVLGNAGRLDKQKAQHLLLELIKILKEKKHNVHLLIAGAGPLENELKSKAKSLNVLKNVTFLGFVSDINAFMSSIDVFVLTSKWEGFGYVIAEAMCYSKPVVAFDISSNPELISNNDNGYLIEPFDVNKMAQAIEKYFANPDSIKQMGNKGREMVSSKFSFSKSIKQIEDYLRK